MADDDPIDLLEAILVKSHMDASMKDAFRLLTRLHAKLICQLEVHNQMHSTFEEGLTERFATLGIRPKLKLHSCEEGVPDVPT